MSATKNKTTTRLGIDTLETRDMMSVSSVVTGGGVVTVYANNYDTSVVVSNISGGIQIRDNTTGAVWNRYGISRVDFVGGNGNDRFVNNVSTLATRAWGQGGNDYLEGYNAVDIFVGGDGNDTLVGYGGNDQMWGGSGNDVLKGMEGNDTLVGDDGADILNGGNGADHMGAATATISSSPSTTRPRTSPRATPATTRCGWTPTTPGSRPRAIPPPA